MKSMTRSEIPLVRQLLASVQSSKHAERNSNQWLTPHKLVEEMSMVADPLLNLAFQAVKQVHLL